MFSGNSFFVWVIAVLLTVANCPRPANAEEVMHLKMQTEGVQRLGLAVPSFSGETELHLAISGVIRGDLKTASRIAVHSGDTSPESNVVGADYEGWHALGVRYVVAGSAHIEDDGRIDTRIRLFDTQDATIIGDLTISFFREQLRAAAHRVSDWVLERAFGIAGDYASKIVYVEESNHGYRLVLSDSDGAGAQTLLRSREPIASPSYSPDGSKVAYVSYEGKRPIIYVQSVETGKRYVLSDYRGINGSPSWSPDGRHLAIVLTRDGGPQIYEIGAHGDGLRRITNSASINTEPRYSADGKWIYFTSDRSGTPQIHRIRLDDGVTERVTNSGNYNISASPSPDGKLVAFLRRERGKYRVAVLELESGRVSVLTNSEADATPRFSRNGRRILLSTSVEGRRAVALLSLESRSVRPLTSGELNAHDPNWGPS